MKNTEKKAFNIIFLLIPLGLFGFLFLISFAWAIKTSLELNLKNSKIEGQQEIIDQLSLDKENEDVTEEEDADHDEEPALAEEIVVEDKVLVSVDANVESIFKKASDFTDFPIFYFKNSTLVEDLTVGGLYLGSKEKDPEFYSVQTKFLKNGVEISTTQGLFATGGACEKIIKIVTSVGEFSDCVTDNYHQVSHEATEESKLLKSKPIYQFIVEGVEQSTVNAIFKDIAKID